MTLDASAYPHLLDAVLSLADRGALLTLRSTSRSLRDAADARLAEHVKLHIPIGGLHVHCPGPRVDIKLLRERIRRLEVTGAGGRLPVFMGWGGAVAPVRRPAIPDIALGTVSPPPVASDVAARRAARRAVRARCAAAISAARTVDITSFPHAWLRDGAPDLESALCAHTYRFHEPWCAWDGRPFAAASAVVFTPLVLGRGEWVIPTPFTRFRGARLVLNLTGFAALDQAEAVAFPPTADAMHIVSVADVTVNLAGLAGKMGKGLGLVFPLARVVFHNPTTRFTLVGAEPALFGVSAHDEIRTALVDVVNRLRTWYPNYWTPEAMESLPRRIIMMSLDEYREELGEERFALEAVP